jgi:hypothetical protein
VPVNDAVNWCRAGVSWFILFKLWLSGLLIGFQLVEWFFYTASFLFDVRDLLIPYSILLTTITNLPKILPICNKIVFNL